MKSYVFIAILLLLFSGLNAAAQTINGSISGSVADQNGANVAGARITATHLATRATREAVTNQDGLYRIAGLPIGAYSVKVEMSGFQPQINERVEVSVAVDSAANFTLSAGTVQEVVTVTESTALLETTQSQVTKVVSEKQILELPGRNNLNGLALLNPGVLPNQNGRPGSGFAVNGNRTRSNNFTMDGANNNDQSLSIPRQVLPPEAIGEFQMITNTFAAEFGRNSGAFVNVITRSGTNDFHGIGHYTWTGNGLNALTTNEQRTYTAQRAAGLADKQALRAARSVTVQNLWGGTLGGPVKKDHTHFFTSFDEAPFRTTVSSVSRVAMTQQAVNNLKANAALFAPGALDYLLKNFPIANDPTPQGSVNITDPVSGATITSVPFQRYNRTLNSGLAYGTDFWRYLAKVTTRLNSKDNLSFRYLIDSFDNIGAPTSLPGQEVGQTTRNQSFTINDVYALTAKLVNESRLTYSRRNINFPEKLGTALAVTGTGGAFTLGNTNFPQFRVDNSYELTDNVSYLTGNHSLKFGVNALRYDLNSFFAPNLRGSISYPSLSALLYDRNASFSQYAGTGSVPARTYETGVFAQDDWRVNADLTLNLGLRYEYVTTPFGFFSKAKSDLNNFGPRVGMAWNPKRFFDGRFVLRSGFALSYDQVFQNILLNVARNYPRGVNVTTGPVNGARPYDGLPAAPAPEEYVRRGGDPNLLALRLFSPNKRIAQPMSRQWTLGVQYQLGRDYVVKLDYIGTQGSNLVREFEQNIGFNAPLGNGQRKDPSKGSILVGDGFASSIYHAGQVTLEKRLSQAHFGDFTFNANYTWSAFISDSDDVLGGQANRTLPADPRNPKLDRARSGFDQPHRFILSGVYTVPELFAGSPVMHRMLSGWELSAITTLASGTPYTVLNANNALGILPGQVATITDSQRVSINAGGQFPLVTGVRADGTLINPSAYFIANRVNSGVIGTLGANTLRTGGTVNADLSLVKNLKTFRESQRLQLRWEMTNAFNRRNFTVIPANVASDNTNLDLFLNLGQTNVAGRTMLFTMRYFF
ncbi:MAG: TonB-dependent receptor [Acidobacteria bacterium]|nr:TonB-dependent receptor [Acidobacteriota bacterium]MBI3422535.1 TonB-dependent receptor [Acidobacteriota bacterium]